MSHSKSTRRDFLERTWQITLGANLGLLGLTQASCSREMTQQDAEEPLVTEPAVDIGNRQGQGGDALVPLTAKQVEVGGEIGRRFMLTIEKNLLALNDDYWLTSFRKKFRETISLCGNR